MDRRTHFQKRQIICTLCYSANFRQENKTSYCKGVNRASIISLFKQTNKQENKQNNINANARTGLTASNLALH